MDYLYLEEVCSVHQTITLFICSFVGVVDYVE